MVPALRPLLVGSPEDRFGLAPHLALALALFAGTFAAYALGIFQISGGVVFVPRDAALVGVVAAVAVGYRRSGMAYAWLVAYASLLGAHADHAFLGLSSQSLPLRLAYFVKLDGLAFLGVEAVVFGTIAYIAGSLVGSGVDAFRSGTVGVF